jgi:putative flavoprotein involved in K+ transport
VAVGDFLKKRHLPFVILDENERIGDAWRKRWDSLRLTDRWSTAATIG